MVSEAPFRHDRSTARNDPGHTFRRERNERQPHARVDREVVHALLGLLDQRVAEDLPSEILGFPVHLLESLVDRHRTNGNGRVTDDPLARLVDVLPRGKIHHGVATPADRPSHLLNFFSDPRSHRRVADIGVDFHQEVAANDHRLGLRVIDVRRDDGAAARHFLADKLRRDGFRDRSSEILARMLTRNQVGQSVSALILADSDEFHLRRDHALSRVVHLRHVPPGPGAARLPLQAEAHVRELWIVEALVAVSRGRAG